MVGHGARAGLGGAYHAGGSVGRVPAQRQFLEQAARGGAPPRGALGFVRRPPTHQPAADDDDLLRHGCSPRATARGRPSFWHPKTARRERRLGSECGATCTASMQIFSVRVSPLL